MFEPPATPRNRWVVLAAALGGLFSVGFSITVLSVAQKTIAADFGVSKNDIVWVITGPILVGAIVTPAAGKLTDLFGARRVYLIAMSCVAFFAALTVIAWSAPSLIFFRVIGAAIGAATGPAAMALINRLFERHERGRALGYWSMVAAGGPVLGMVGGGPVVEAFGWRWIFVAQVPFSIATVLVCARVFPETPRKKARFDYLGAVLLGFGGTSFVLALNRAPEPGWGWTHPLILLMFAATPIMLTAFVVYERRIEHQLIPLRYFKRRNFAFPIANSFFANFAYMGGFFLTPYLLQEVLHYGETKTGLVSIARPILFTIVGPFAGWLSTRVGERVSAVAGGAFLFGSMVLFSLVGVESGLPLVIVALAMSGIGMGATAPAMTASVANAVDDEDLGVAGGAQQMFNQLGVVVGTQVLFTMVSLTTAPGMSDAELAAGYSKGYLLGALGAVFAIGCALMVHRTVHPSAEQEPTTGHPVLDVLERESVETALADAR